MQLTRDLYAKLLSKSSAVELMLALYARKEWEQLSALQASCPIGQTAGAIVASGYRRARAQATIKDGADSCMMWHIWCGATGIRIGSLTLTDTSD